MKFKRSLAVMSIAALAIVASICTVAFAGNNEEELEELKEVKASEVMDEQEMAVETFDDYEYAEGITGHELTAGEVIESASVDALEPYFFSGAKSGQYALSSSAYAIPEGKGSFEYAINWGPMGNDIRVGLISADKSDMYFVACMSGTGEGTIGTTRIPAGSYFVMACNEPSSSLDLMGTITYEFKQAADTAQGNRL